MFKRISLMLIILGAVAMLTLAAKPAPKLKVKVLDRVRLTVETEDLEYVASGSLAGQLVLIDDSHVYGTRINKRGRSEPKLLFDVMDVPGRPNGIAYAESLGLFVIDSRDHPDTLYFVNSKGKLKYERTIQYLDGFLPSGGVEGLAYIPLSSTAFPDHLVLVAIDENDNGHLQVINLDGQVEKSIPVPQSTNGETPGAVTFLPPDNLLVGTYGGPTLVTLDFDGEIVQPLPPPYPDLVDLIGGFEALARIPNGFIIGAGSYGNLVYFDENLNRLPELDQVYAPNLGLVGPNGIAWDSQAERFLFHSLTFDPARQSHVVTVPPSLDSTTPLADINPTYRLRGLAYLPDEHSFAMAQNLYEGTNPSIGIFNMDTDGNPYETIDLSSIGSGIPTCLTYIPRDDDFAVVFEGSQTSLTIVNRAGQPVRSVDLAPKGVQVIRSVAFFTAGHPRGGQFLIHAEPGRRLLVTDFEFNVLGEFDAYSTLGLTRLGFYDLAAITSGGYEGAFAIYGDSGELVIFSIK